MQRSSPIRLLTAATLAVSALSLAAQATPAPATKPSAATPSTLPATQPTTPQAPAAPLPPPTPAQLPPSHAQVTYTDGALFVAASNSSLNQILREISRETGINISGGVADERVFGQYGPDSPAQILTALLDGTGSNMLLIQGNGNTPAELVLTPRQGGPTPPNPSAHAFDEAPEPRTISNADPSDSQPAEQPPPHPSASVPVTPETPAAAATDSAQPQSPNGVKTPQQIYDQLQKLRQQPPATNPQ